MARIFISYRRDDTRDVVGNIYDRLVVSFGKGNVFRDIESIPLGEDFEHRLQQALAKCNVGLVLIGPKWASATNEAGEPRLLAPDDFVRLELAYLLKRQIPIIPVLVHGATMPASSSLPSSIAQVTNFQGIALRPDAHFETDLSGLIREVRARARWQPNYPWVVVGTVGSLAATVSGVLAISLYRIAGALAIVGLVLGIVGLASGLLAWPISYIFAVVRSWRLKQWRWFWVLAAALLAIVIVPLILITIVTLAFNYTALYTLWVTYSVVLSGLGVWLLAVTVFGLVGPIDTRISRLRASASASSNILVAPPAQRPQLPVSPGTIPPAPEMGPSTALPYAQLLPSAPVPGPAGATAAVPDRHTRWSYPRLFWMAIFGQVCWAAFLLIEILGLGTPSGFLARSPVGGLVALVLWIGFILLLVAFVYSTVKAAQFRHWGWFIGLLISFVVLAFFAPALGTIWFALRGPTSKRAVTTANLPVEIPAHRPHVS